MKKHFYLLPIIILSLLPISAPLISSSNSEKASIMAASSMQSNIKIITKEINSKDPSLELNLRYPFLSNSSNDSKLNQINTTLKDYIENFKAEMLKSSNEDLKKSNSNSLPRPYTANADFEIKYSNSSIISLYINYYQYTGGAHGNHGKTTFTFDLNSGRQLQLKDIFKVGTDYKKLLVPEIEKLMKDRQVNYFDDAIYTIRKLSGTQPFYLTNEGLVIHYGLYEITPYSTGTQEFIIPYNIIKEYLLISI